MAAKKVRKDFTKTTVVSKDSEFSDLEIEEISKDSEFTNLETAEETLDKIDQQIIQNKVDPGSQAYLTKMNVKVCPTCGQPLLKNLMGETINPENCSDPFHNQ